MPMEPIPQRRSWAFWARQYLALRSGEYLQRAISEADSPAIVDLLRAYQRRDRTGTDRLVAAFGSSETDSEDSLTVRLLQLDQVMDPSISDRISGSEERTQQHRMRLEACGTAIDVSEQLQDAGCVAFFAAHMASGLSTTGAYDRARPVFERAAELYRSLAGESVLYAELLARTLSALGNVLQRSQKFRESWEAYKETIPIWRKLSEDEPQTYRRELAEALTNTANSNSAGPVDLPSARRLCEEAVQIWRILETEQPHTYRPKLAWALNSLGYVLHELEEVEKSRDLLKEAASLWYALAEHKPEAYRAYLTWCLKSLGKVLVELDELSHALPVWRELVKREPKAHGAEVANKLIELSHTFGESGNLEKSCQTLGYAVQICREAMHYDSTACGPELAHALMLQTTVLGQRRKFEEARSVGEEALQVWRRLANDDPRTCLPNLALALVMLGNARLELAEIEESRELFEEAVQIYQVLPPKDVEAHLRGLVLVLTRLADAFSNLVRTNPRAYGPSLAKTLTGLGHVLYQLKDCKTALKFYTEALQTWHQLDFRVHTPGFGETLAGSSSALYRLGDPENARKRLVIASRILKDEGRFSEAAFWFQDWAHGELANENTTEAIGLFEEAVFSVEAGMNTVGSSPSIDRARRDKVKSSVDLSYQALIEWQAVLINKHARERTRVATPCEDWREEAYKLVGLLESQRRAELLSEFGVFYSQVSRWEKTLLSEPLPLAAPRAALNDDDGVRALQSVFDAIYDANERHPVAEAFLRFRSGYGGAAFLWIHVSKTKVIFALLAPSHWGVYVTEKDDLLRRLKDLRDYATELLRSEELKTYVDRPELWLRGRPGGRLRWLGARAFELLPKEVQNILTCNDCGVIFLAPCPETMNLPFDLLLPDEKAEYPSLLRLLVWTHGLSELTQVLPRSPKGDVAILVGNPPHPPLASLTEAEKAVNGLCARLGLRGDWTVNRLVGRDATEESISTALRREQPRLWVYAGHGEPRTLLVAAGNCGNKGFVSQKSVADMAWHNEPLIHFDCCFAGHILGSGGGRFEGLPTAALLAGASTVVSSAYPLYDKPAADFSKYFYDALLPREAFTIAPCNVGRALLQARQKIHKEYGGNPVLWATTEVWGNPWACL